MFIFNNFIHGNNVEVMIKASESLGMYAFRTEKVLDLRSFKALRSVELIW